MKNKNIYIILAVLIIIIIAFFVIIKNSQKNSPEKIIKQYFKDWNNENYKGMYEVISDGFKEIDPNAKDLETFKSYAKSQGIKRVKIIKIKETLNSKESATVDYSVEFKISNGKIIPFEDTFTLKYKKNDKIPGWKLIHPYGENIDTS